MIRSLRGGVVAGSLAAIALTAFACGAEREPSPPLGVVRQKSIFGADDRRDYYAQPDTELRRLTREAIVAPIAGARLDFSDPANVRVAATPTYQQASNLCADQPFGDQPTVAHCSSTLIDDDLLITAGHCFVDLAECQAFLYAFDYFYESAGQLATISRDDVFGCRSMPVQAERNAGARGRLDYAIIQLDRPVSASRKPVPLAPALGGLAQGDRVSAIGFGHGVPAKLDNGGVLLHPPLVDGVIATIDSLPGNSGSGAFRTDYTLMGVVVGSTGVFVTQDGGCKAIHTLPETGAPPAGAATDIRFARNAIDDLCATGWPSQRLCGVAAACGDGKCTGTETNATCGADCPAPSCGDHLCELGEEKSCPVDCGFGCSATSCEAGLACGDAGTCVPSSEPDAGPTEPDAATPAPPGTTPPPAPTLTPKPDETPPTNSADDGGCSTARLHKAGGPGSAWVLGGLFSVLAMARRRRRA